MWKNLWQNKTALALLSGIFIVPAFPPIEIIPTVFFFPIFFMRLLSLCRGAKQGFLFGFLPSLVIMAGGFYWVIYVIHVFGYIPWSISTLMYLVFCGFGCLNFPIFAAIAVQLQSKISCLNQGGRAERLWVILMLPMLFTLVEFAIPKLFPWSVGQCLYRQLWLIQIVEITGSAFLTFFVLLTGSGMYWAGCHWKSHPRERLVLAPIVGIWLLLIGFSWYRMQGPLPQGRDLTVGIIQANIGSLEKVRARKSIVSAVRYTMERYQTLSIKSLAMEPKPDLLLWPETAMPFQLDSFGIWSQQIQDFVKKTGVMLISGAYSKGKYERNLDNNAAYLLEPKDDGTLEIDIYRKNILLAFGEYFPGGDLLPKVYKWFPQVSHFERGREQNIFELLDGTKIGATICYEAIVPSYYRKVVNNGPHLIINLTNDSWFGPTSEPYQHGALTIFRAIEFRIPFFRATNTGISFAVDTMGRMSPTTPVYGEGILNWTLRLPKDSPRTVYLRFGEWFLMLCGIIFLVLISWMRKNNVSLSH